MGITEIIKAAIDIGITPVLLIVFIWYFLKKDEKRDSLLSSVLENFKERESILLVEGSRREELLRQESDKREKLMRNEAEKRENMLMSTIEQQSRTMEKIAETMKQIEISHVQVLEKVNNIENYLERMGHKDG